MDFWKIGTFLYINMRVGLIFSSILIFLNTNLQFFLPRYINAPNTYFLTISIKIENFHLKSSFYKRSTIFLPLSIILYMFPGSKSLSILIFYWPGAPLMAALRGRDVRGRPEVVGRPAPPLLLPSAWGKEQRIWIMWEDDLRWLNDLLHHYHFLQSGEKKIGYHQSNRLRI